MKDLAYLTEKYGPDFLAKLPMYKTAKLFNRYVAILSVNLETMKARIRWQQGGIQDCDIAALDDFCL